MTSDLATKLFFPAALLGRTVARDVAITIRDGVIANIQTGVAAPPMDACRGEGLALPGQISLHSHAFQRAMAGRAERRGPGADSFWTWRQAMYASIASMGPDDVEAIAAFAYMDMLEAGFASVGEFHYLHHDPDGRPYADRAELSARVASGAQTAGIGLTLLPALYQSGNFGGAPATSGQRRFLNDLDGFLRIREGARRAVAAMPDAAVGIAPHSLRAVDPAALAALLAAVEEGPVHIHIAEQRREVEDCVAWSGKRPVEWLLDNAEVDARWCLIHATHMTPSETARMARSGAVAGLCPITEANLGDGTFAAPEFLAAGGAFGVGTDSNVQIDAPGELRLLEYSQRLARQGRNLIAGTKGESSGLALYAGAARGGAQAIGRRAGVLEVGARADIVTLDPRHPDLAVAAFEDWLDIYVFVAGRRAVADVYVGGRKRVENGRHRGREAIIAAALSARRRLEAH